MNKLLLTLGFVAALGACGGGGGFDEILKKGKAFKDATCACKDSACVDKVEKDMEAWMEKAAKSFKGKPSKAQDEAWDKIDDESDACKKKIKTAEADAKATAAIGKMKAFKDQACACTDAACATKVQTDMGAWAEAEGKAMSDGGDPSPELTKQIADIGQQMGECMMKAMTPPPPPPPAADPAAPPAP